MPNSNNNLMIAIFHDEINVISAVKAMNQAQIDIFDVITPYPIHELMHLLKWRKTRLAGVCLVMGCIGFCFALLFQLWVFMSNWPLNVGGKSFSALPALIPVSFEFTILLAALGTVAAFFIRAKLWPGKKYVPVYPRLTNDNFAILVQWNVISKNSICQIFQQANAIEVKEIVEME